MVNNKIISSKKPALIPMYLNTNQPRLVSWLLPTEPCFQISQYGDYIKVQRLDSFEGYVLKSQIEEISIPITNPAHAMGPCKTRKTRNLPSIYLPEYSPIWNFDDITKRIYFEHRNVDIIGTVLKGTFDIEEMCSFALNCLHVVYTPGGRSFAGFDAFGLVQFLYRRIGIELPISLNINEEIAYKVPINKKWQPGDLLFFCNKHTLQSVHVGMFLEDKVLHVCQETGFVVHEELFDKELQNGTYTMTKVIRFMNPI